MKGLNDKRIIVAGGGSGIGRATAERLGGEGVSVAVGDINLPSAQATATRITEAGGRAIAIAFDLGDEESVEQLTAQTIAAFGGVDGLFNVAADTSERVLGHDGDLLRMDVDVWRRTLEVNLIGYALTARSVLPTFIEQGHGVIVNTSSAAAHVGDQQRAAYQTSKAGINALTRHIATRWGRDGIRANAVSPGVVLTESAERMALTPEGLAFVKQTIPSTRLGAPEDLAGIVSFLLSDDAEWINGQVWSINGGLLLRE
ncbi:NAD(P)-dependent dehydrogenase, short-chain alcohol dehydrogenase family [Herbiconiux ginsengi]|uniref:NAD(P)-dependent dehydrogenase, short-chain alcohol dehydrogenase family n=2 Tax=Herbiconiux ginsengi TaxID=381665 RepID=A0A1H3LLH8_9MICO|nr:NAD(P)-dependent dehydrogenase, short-chain alcohol dehydrogenase family [Herbiconiux ginsengi]